MKKDDINNKKAIKYICRFIKLSHTHFYLYKKLHNSINK